MLDSCSVKNCVNTYTVIERDKSGLSSPHAPSLFLEFIEYSNFLTRSWSEAVKRNNLGLFSCDIVVPKS